MNAAQTLIDHLMGAAAVSDAVISATGDKVATTGRFTRCSASETLDIEKTVRRMLAASSTIGATLSQVTLHFGAQLLLAVPVSAEVNVLVVLEDSGAIEEVVALVRGSSLASSLDATGA